MKVTNHSFTDQDGRLLESAFQGGIMDNQTMKGSKGNPTRQSMDKSKGLGQPVRRGTVERVHAPFKGNRV